MFADRITPSASVISALLVDHCTREAPRVAIPRAELVLGVRIGACAKDGLDLHALGMRPIVYRKRIPAGQRTIMARFQLGASRAVFGVPAAELAGRLVPLEDLWGERAARELRARMLDAPDALAAARVLDRAIGDRVRSYDPAGLALDAALRLEHERVSTVADELGVSERHLRRVFNDIVGVSPKTYSKLARFHRALDAARKRPQQSWASIAAATGYYDQAHLIGEFRAIAGKSPRAFLDELTA